MIWERNVEHTHWVTQTADGTDLSVHRIEEDVWIWDAEDGSLTATGRARSKREAMRIARSVAAIWDATNGRDASS